MFKEAIPPRTSSVSSDMNMSHQSPPGAPYHPAASTYSTEHSISFGNLFLGIWRRKFLISLVFGVLVAGVVFWLSTAERRYTPELRILIENNENPFTQPQTAINQRNTVDKNEVTSQVQVLLSSDLARKVARDLELSQYTQFNSAAKQDGLFTELFKLLGLHTEPTSQKVEQKVVERYFKNLNVYPVQNSRVIVVEFTSTDPELAAKVANAVGETYVRATREVKYDAAKAAMTWLSGEIGRLRRTVASSEAAVEEFRARKGLFKSDDTTLDAQELAGINSQIILASAARSEAEARARAIREMLKSTGGVNASSDVLNSTVIQRLREQQVTLQRTVADLEATYLPTHPRMERLAAEIAGLSAQIKSEALKIVKSLESEVEVQTAREAELRANLAQLKTKASTSNQDEITLRALEREAEANRSLLQTFLQRFTEASARQDISALPAGARIISRAQVLGKPTFPKTKPLFLMGVVGAAIAAILVAFIAEVFSMAPAPTPLAAGGMRNEPGFAMQPQAQSASPPAPPAPPQSQPQVPIQDPQPERAPAPPAVEQPADLPEFGPILEELESVSATSADLAQAGSLCVNDPLCEFSLSVRRIYQKMRDAAHAAGTKRYVWTSAEELADSVPVLVNLARTFAQNGNKTILVDTDFGSSELIDAFKTAGGVGLSELLAGRAAFTDAIVRDTASGVHLLRQGENIDQARSLVGGQRMDYILDALDQAYEAVIILVPPMTDPAAREVAAKSAYAVIFAEASKAGLKAGSAAKHMLTSLGVEHSSGVVVQSNGMFGRLMSKYRSAA